MELEINDFDIELLTINKKCFIIGDICTGKSTLIENFMKYLNIKGTIFTDKNHMNTFYSNYNPMNIYKRYTPLLNQRLFINNTCIILDNYQVYKPIYLEIIQNIIKKNMLLLIAYTSFIDFIEFDYIFICKLTNDNEILNIQQQEYIKKYYTFEEFKSIINECVNDTDILIINTNANTVNELFMIY